MIITSTIGGLQIFDEPRMFDNTGEGGPAQQWLTITLSESRPPDPAKMAVVGAVVAGVYALAGTLLTQWLPEPTSTTNN